MTNYVYNMFDKPIPYTKGNVENKNIIIQVPFEIYYLWPFHNNLENEEIVQ